MKTHKLGVLLLLAAVALFAAACNLESGEATEEPLPTQTATEVSQATEEPTEEATDLPTATPTQIQVQTALPPNCTPRTDWTITYTVVSGDTLARIAARSNTTVNQLTQGNCLANPNVLSVGQVLRVPNPVATVTPEVTTCQYFTTGAPPIYETQAFLTQISTVSSNQRYPVTRFNNSYYQISLPDGRRGWVQAVSGQLEGNCDEVQRYVEFQGTRAPDYRCYYIGATTFEATVDQAGTNDFTVELLPYFAYRVDGRIPGKVRIFAGEQVPFPVWASLNDGRIIGECDSLPDVSIATTQSVPKTTYSDSAYGFAFDYPSNWPMIFNSDGLRGGSVGTISFANSYPSALGWPSDVTDVSWSILPSDFASSAEEAARSYAQDIEESNSRMQVIEPVEPYTNPRGLSGWRFVLSFPGATSEVYYFDIGESVLGITISGNIGLGASVVESTRIVE